MSTCTSRSLVTLHALVAVCILFTCGRPSLAGVVYVKATTPGSVHDGTSWAAAFTTVTAGLNAAVSGDEVWVAAATYREAGSPPDYKLFTLKSGVGLFGGFAGTETVRTQRDPSKNVTILDGGLGAPIVTIAADATSDTVLDGFTIQNGTAEVIAGYGGMGGGVHIDGGTPVISGNIIRGCATAGDRYINSYGGGVFVAGGMPLIAGNTIIGNTSLYGGGIYALGGLMRDNLISFNQAGPGYTGNGGGGGIFLVFPAVAIHNVIMANKAAGDGGGAACAGTVMMDNVFEDNNCAYGAALQCGGHSTIIRNTITDSNPEYQECEVEFAGGTFSDNLVVSHSTGGIYLGSTGNGNNDGSQPHISNNTIVQTGPNYTSVAPVGIGSWYINGERPVLANNIVVGWQTAGYTVDTTGTQPVFVVENNNVFGNTNNTLALPGASQIGANGNISQDPLFVDAANGDYRLQAGSPCIDAGNDAYVATGDRDAEGRPRIAGAHVDIGAYEYGSPLYTMLDAAEVLRISAGLSICTPANVSRLNVVPESPGLTLADATRIAQWMLN